MRLLLNTLITVVLLVFFIGLGWMRVLPQDGVNLYAEVGAIAFVMNITLMAAGLLFGLFVVASCGLGCFLLPLYWVLMGQIIFWGAKFMFPQWISVTDNTLQVVLMGLAVGMIRIPSATTKTATE